MRARRHRPMFDSLDARVVLDSGADLVSGGNVGSTVLAAVGPNAPSCQPNLTDIVDWNLSGTPPTTGDPAQATIPLDLLPAS